ncbi:hypothetical protein WN943_015612 [Citrus x changshan-huyou]
MAGMMSSSLRRSIAPTNSLSLLRKPHLLLQSFYSSKSSPAFSSSPETLNDENDAVPTSGISRPLSEILKELNKNVPNSLIKIRVEDGFSMKYIPWHIVNRIMNLHAPEWSGEVRNITYSVDGKTVSVVYRVTIYGTDAERCIATIGRSSCIATIGRRSIVSLVVRESTGTALVDEQGYGDAVQKAEAMAFRRACARFGLGLHLYHEDLL